MKLVANWRDCWRWLSMHAMALSAAEVTAWTQLSPTWTAALPAWVFPCVVLSTLALGMIGRVVDQSKPTGD
jgi:hypothetical protein